MKTRFAKKEKGQSFIELGISMVFLLTLLAGLVDLGRAIFTYISIRDAVQEGASYGAINPSDCTGIVNRVRSYTSGAIELTSSDIIVTVLVDNNKDLNVTDLKACTAATAANLCPGNPIKVAITYPNFRIAMPFIGAFVGGQSLSFGADVTDSILVDPLPKSCN
jgi:Flp pilus assembly protein TadG